MRCEVELRQVGVRHLLPPAGVLQSDELDYTVHSPITLQAVVIP
jgi:hypothetical protein